MGNIVLVWNEDRAGFVKWKRRSKVKDYDQVYGVVIGLKFFEVSLARGWDGAIDKSEFRRKRYRSELYNEANQGSKPD